MRERRCLKVISLMSVLVGINLVMPNTTGGQEMSFSKGYTRVADFTARNVIVIGFVGGFVRSDDAKHPEVQFATYLRDRYPSIHAEVLGNHHGKKAIQEIMRLLDTDHDGTLTSLEKQRATIIIYGHSWGASETVAFARKLGEMDIPVTLTIQIDTIGKPFHKSLTISPNVASAINFYQTEGPLHGRPEIVVADPARTKTIGNFRMTYEDRPINCDNYTWYARVFNKPHHKIENDLRVWDEAALLIDSDLSGTITSRQVPLPSRSTLFKYLRRGVQADTAALALPEIANK